MSRILALTLVLCSFVPAVAGAASGGSGILVEARVRGYGMTGWAGDVGRQTIELQSYYPVGEKDKRFYPQPLRELVCRLERLRVHAALRYVPLEWCTPNP